MKVRYEGKVQYADLPVHVTSEAEARPLPDDYPGEAVQQEWSGTVASGRANLFTEDRAALAEVFGRLVPLLLRRHGGDRRPLDVRLTRYFVAATRSKPGSIDPSVGEGVRGIFAGALAAAQPVDRAQLTPADLGQRLPVGARNIQHLKLKDPTLNEGYLLTVHPDPRPGWTAADYRQARELDGLQFVPSRAALVDAAVWELRHVVAGAVGRAVEQAKAAADKTATVEPISLRLQSHIAASAQVHQSRQTRLATQVGELVTAALDAHRQPDGTLPGGVRIISPRVVVVAGKPRTEQTVVGVTVGGDTAGVPGPRPAAATRPAGRRAVALAEPGLPGLQWQGTRLRGPGLLDPADLEKLWSWANVMWPLMKARQENRVGPFELQVVQYDRLPRDPGDRARLEEVPRRLVLGMLSAVAGRDGLRRPADYPEQAVSVVLRARKGINRGFELWLQPDPGWTVAGYQAAGALDVVFAPGAVTLHPVQEQRVRWMIAQAARRAAAAGVDRFPVEVG
ncbi:hypothetical protein, partial [Amycolatopsis sp. NPDC051061]|uniref:hypothetical protein n=1 Tax=Amycolatopsis sp. NPDC051061 TaxID=3155042 RepID=UPI00342A742F